MRIDGDVSILWIAFFFLLFLHDVVLDLLLEVEVVQPIVVACHVVVEVVYLGDEVDSSAGFLHDGYGYC